MTFPDSTKKAPNVFLDVSGDNSEIVESTPIPETAIVTTSSAPPPVSNFTGTPLSGLVDLLVSFTDQSTGSITSWNWDFGDGNTDATQNPSHTYTSAGIYTVSLTVTGPGGSSTNTKVSYIQAIVIPPPVADFIGNPLSGVSPLEVSFTDQSTGSITSWNWDFGDGNTDTTQNPSHTYANPGTYTVSLTVSGIGGSNTNTKVSYINVLYPPPVADFIGNPLSGVSPLEVSFTDQSSGVITSWNWDFGDGNTDTTQNPSHTYANPGTYTVALTTTGPGGTDTNTKVSYINVLYPPPVADFIGNPLSGFIPLSVSFTDQSTGVITSWNWDFGDGNTDTTQNPTNVYNTDGSFTVSLTVSGPGGTDTNTKVAYVTAMYAAPVADFVATPLIGIAPLDVSFTDQSTGVISIWRWDFGDGDISNSFSQNPIYTYNFPGIYTVTLTVVGPGGGDTITRQNYITVQAPPPVASFYGRPNNPLINGFTTFFGENLTPNREVVGDPVIARNNFLASLTGGVSSNGFDNPDDGFRFNQVAPIEVTFPGSTGNIVATINDNGDGNLSIFPYGPGRFNTTSGVPDYTALWWDTSGVFTIDFSSPISAFGFYGTDIGDFNGRVTVTLRDINGVDHLYTIPNTVNGPDGTLLFWGFIDGLLSYNKITFGNTSSGTDAFGFDDFVIGDYNQISPVPDPSSPIVGPAPLTINFIDTTTGNPTSWAWDFQNNGSIDSTSQNPTFTYTSAGTYTVNMTATGIGGSSTYSRPVVVTSGASSRFLNFEDTSNGAYIQSFYNGGTNSYAVRGPAYGIDFDGNAVGGYYPNAHSPYQVVSMDPNQGNSYFINVASGFSGTVTLWAISTTSTTIQLTSDLSGAGTVLATITGIFGNTSPVTWQLITLTPSSTAKSIAITNAAKNLIIDDLTINF